MKLYADDDAIAVLSKFAPVPRINNTDSEAHDLPRTSIQDYGSVLATARLRCTGDKTYMAEGLEAMVECVLSTRR